MIKRHFILILLLFALLAAGCNDQPFNTGTIRIRLEMPEQQPGMTVDSIPVSITNQTTGVSYTSLTDRLGEASFELAAGVCRVYIHTTVTRGNMDYILSGGRTNLYFEGGGEALSLTLPLEVTAKGRLIIEELYFGGCLRPDGKTTYVADQYITVANNSDDIYYLDGLCIGQAGPTTTSRPSGWMLHTDMKEIPLFLMCWQFPGEGTDYPLLPGERQVIATQAIDHTAGIGGVPASLDLSRVEWAFWDSKLTGSKITAGVKPLRLVWRSSGSSYALTTNGPTLLLFRPESDIEAWASEPSHLRTEPNQPGKQLFLHIPASWVLDAPNFVSSESTVVNSRLPLAMDANPGIAGASGMGLAKHRKKLTTPDGSGWCDTNNTLADFEAATPSLKTNK